MAKLSVPVLVKRAIARFRHGNEFIKLKGENELLITISQGKDCRA